VPAALLHDLSKLDYIVSLYYQISIQCHSMC